MKKVLALIALSSLSLVACGDKEGAAHLVVVHQPQQAAYLSLAPLI